MLRKKLPRIWRIEKTLLSRGKYWKNSEDWKIFTQLDQESRTVSRLRDQVRRLPELLVYIEDSKKSSTILTHRAVMTVLAFLIKLSLLRVQESLAAILECCEIHERIWVFLETFLSVNMLDEILMNYTMIQENWRQHQRFWEQKELRKVEAKNHCNRYLYLAFRKEQDKKSRRWKVSCVYD